MKNTIIDTKKLYTQSEYAKLKGLTRQRINQLVKSKDIKTVEINGAVLIIVE